MPKRNISGIFLLDKPKNISSSFALIRTRGIFKANKGGHTGALDPLASGLLPICLGEAAKFSSFFLEGKKRYIAEGYLGKTTTTGDLEGEIVESRDLGDALINLESVLNQFRGKIKQTPPIYSALKINGKALYLYAREGKSVDIPSRDIEIYELKLLEVNAPLFKVEVYCSKGTYIRTLITDIGEALGCGAHVVNLHRTYVEGLEGEMMSLDELQALCDSREDKNDFSLLDQHLIPLEKALNNLPIIDLNYELAHKLSFGMPLDDAYVKAQAQYGDNIVQMRYQNHFLGVGSFTQENILKPKRLLSPESILSKIN